jgi:AcrR family transcriptional regulator
MSSIDLADAPTRVSAGAAPAGRGAAREQAICNAVMDLLTETSFDALTIDAVAARAKASKATIYRRWAGRDELVLDVIRREFLHAGAVPADTGSLRGDLLAALTRDLCPGGTGTAAGTVSPYKLAAIRSLSTALTTAPELVSKVVAELTEVQVQMWRILLDRALHRGEITTAVPAELCSEVLRAQLFAQAVFGSLDGSGSVGGCPNAATGEPDVALVRLVDDILLPVVAHAGRAEVPEGR